MRFSVIIPLYNRPQEIDELLHSLTLQSYKDFEVLVVEDGSTDRAEGVVSKYFEKLDVQYFYKENSRQGFSRNFGFERAKGDWMVVFDSDCIIPPSYFELVHEFLLNHPDVDVYGGPDASHPDFSDWQKAISYSMTSPLTTGGIRGGNKTIGTFHPRSFNMGISRKAWEVTQGYKISVKGEDIEFSLRIVEHGLKTSLIPQAFVYHKRRTNFRQFSEQVTFFGRARINIKQFYPHELKWIHWMPSLFFLYSRMVILLFLIQWFIPLEPWLFIAAAPLLGWSFGILIHASWTTRNLKIGLLSLAAGFIQLSGYGKGLLSEFVTVILLRQRNSTIGEVRNVPEPAKTRAQ